MTTPEQGDPERLNEPELLKTEGYLNRAWRRLGEGLGPFVADKTGQERFNTIRDVHAILTEMDKSWDVHFSAVKREERDRSPRSWVTDLLSFRNGPWAHLIGYSDHDVLRYLHQISQLLRIVSANEQARMVEQMYKELGQLLFSETQPEPYRDSEIAELRQRISELENFNKSHQRTQREDDQSDDASTLVGDHGGKSDFFSVRLLSEEEYSQAIAELDEILRLNPSNASAYVDRARVHSEKLEHGLAIDDYSTALRLDPDNAATYVERGNLYYGPIRDIESAIADYTSALLHNPRYAHNHVVRAIAYSEVQEYDLAIADYSAALEVSSEDAAAFHMLRGNINAKKEELDLAIADYTAAMQLAPDEVSIHIVRGNAYRYGKGDYDLAIADYSNALIIHPDCVVALVERGELHAENELWGQAIADFSAGLEHFRPRIGAYLDPGATYRLNKTADMPSFFEFLDADLPTLYLNRGKAYLEIRNLESAISDFSAALDCDPQELCRLLSGQQYHWYAYYSRGVVYAEQGRYDLATADFEDAIRTCPAWHGKAVEQLRKIRDETVRTQEGKTEYNQYIEENPDDPQGWHLRGILYFDLGDRQQAVADFTQAIRLAPHDAEPLNERGRAYWEQGQDDLAYADYSRAIELNPVLANAFYNRAWILRRRGDPRDAIIDFSQAIALNPEYAAAYQHRGISYFDIGEQQKAQADFDMARSLGFEP